jgi:uncharacterized membrane protein
MPDKIEVKVTPSTFRIGAGTTAEANIALRNLGQSVDQFTIAVEGLPSDWYTIPVASVALFPNDHDNLKLILNPPVEGMSKSGVYPFKIKVSSQETPVQTVTIDSIIEVELPLELEISISPQSINGRKGKYQIAAHNPSGVETDITLKYVDAQGLQYSLIPEAFKIPANGRAESILEVRAGWKALFWGRRQIDFQVIAAHPGTEEGKSISARLVNVPWYMVLVQIPSIISAWFERRPVIQEFQAASDDKRQFTLHWSVKRARQVMLDGEKVGLKGEQPVSPAASTSYVLVARNKYKTMTQSVEVKPVQAPVARSSERIGAVLSPETLQAQAGGISTMATLQLQNLGNTVDRFQIGVEGIENTWYRLSAASIALMPQTKDQMQIIFQPPKKKGVRSGQYPFGVVVHSQSAPQDFSSITGQIEVLPGIEFKVSIRPYRITTHGKGSFRVSLNNVGVSDTRFKLEATDLDEGLDFKFKDDVPEVGAWKTLEVPMVARLKKGKRVGEKKRYDITLTATADDSKSQTATAEFNHTPAISSWRLIFRIVRAVVVIAAVVVAIYFILKLGGGWSELKDHPQAWVERTVNTIQGWFNR